MFLLADRLRWSASDLTLAAECEYALLRTADTKLNRASAVAAEDDPLLRHIASLGDRHEQEILNDYQRGSRVAVVPTVPLPYSLPLLEAAASTTADALRDGPDVVYQAAFFDGEFFGYADFVERSDSGWVVCDAKLARQARPKALLQLGAYAEQIRSLGVPLAPYVTLLLGTGERQDFPLSDIRPVFLERRDRLRELLHRHQRATDAAVWDDGAAYACGRCAECLAAAEASEDVLLVAGVRMAQRRRLAEVGVRTVSDLADAPTRPARMSEGAFERLRHQARLQSDSRASAGDVVHELAPDAATTLAHLPAPSAGDLFFDFEGDPLYHEGDPSDVGLEYLWGTMDAEGTYRPLWAHSWAEEKHAFETFVDDLTARRARFPDLHVYHYAAYETTALKHLAIRYQTREDELDQLLRSEVFVDLYATVRGSVVISAPSYSIKMLEPLYMGDQRRPEDDEAVAEGAGSVVAYHQYRTLARDDEEGAAGRLKALEDYNKYDCLSTWKLRDWLLGRARAAGVRGSIVPRTGDNTADESPTEQPAGEMDALVGSLRARSGAGPGASRTPTEQAYAMLAAAVGYYRRERKQFWWEHFERLQHPVVDWAGTRNVFVAQSTDVEQDWHRPPRARNHRRRLLLRGEWGPGSSREGSAREICTIYAAPGPPGTDGPEGAIYHAGVGEITSSEADPGVVTLEESTKPSEAFDAQPVAITPAPPPNAGVIEDAIAEVGVASLARSDLPATAALDILALRRPRLRSGEPLPQSVDTVADVVAALRGMDNSYVAVQGPPGAGKTYTACHVIKELVEEHHWRIGVVAQSHTVVENLLRSCVKTGLDHALIGKGGNKTTPTWTEVKNTSEARADFLANHTGTGCVLGGTAWLFATEKSVERGSLDLLVVEEAGQFAVAPTIGAAVSAQRLLVLGDPQQLPQVSQGRHPEPVQESALGWLMQGHDTIPGEYGYFLGQSYRMHPELSEKVSILSYEGRLASAPPASERAMDGVPPGLGVVEVTHVDNSTESPEEADVVLQQVRHFLGRGWTNPDAAPGTRPIGQDDVLVVAPFNAQVNLIRRTLDAAGYPDVRVGTVDKFQGQEAPVVIVSLAVSSPADVPRGMRFVLSRNRVNVAVSRAQWRAVIVRSPSLTAYVPASAEALLELGAFIGLCRSATPA